MGPQVVIEPSDPRFKKPSSRLCFSLLGVSPLALPCRGPDPSPMVTPCSTLNRFWTLGRGIVDDSVPRMTPSSPREPLQPWRDPHDRVVRAALMVALVGSSMVALGLSLPKSTVGFVILFVGFIGLCFAFFFGLGSHLKRARRRRSIAAMARGEVLGRWVMADGTHRKVEVGSDLAIVGGHLVEWSGRFVWPILVTVPSASGDIRINIVANAGYSTVASRVDIPAGADREEALVCARAIAEHHGIPLDLGEK